MDKVGNTPEHIRQYRWFIHGPPYLLFLSTALTIAGHKQLTLVYLLSINEESKNINNIMN